LRRIWGATGRLEELFSVFHFLFSVKELVAQASRRCGKEGLVVNWQNYPFKGAIGCQLEDVLESMA
jgi:hypothetical protein